MPLLYHRLLARALSRRSPGYVHLAAGRVPARVRDTGHYCALVVHNHPSRDPTPSPDDARLTLRLAQADDILDIALLDHALARRVLACGCLFALDNEARTTSQLSYAETALAHARLAAIADRIVNCWLLERLVAWLRNPSLKRVCGEPRLR